MENKTILKLDYDSSRKVFSLSKEKNGALCLPGGCFYQKKVRPIIIDNKRVSAPGFVESNGSHAYLIINYVTFTQNEEIGASDTPTVITKGETYETQ